MIAWLAYGQPSCSAAQQKISEGSHQGEKEREHIKLLSRRCKKVHLLCADKKSYEIVFP